MKIVLELKNKPEKGDILVFDGEKFEAINWNLMVSQLVAKNNELNLAINNIDKTLNELNNEIKYLKGE